MGRSRMRVNHDDVSFPHCRPYHEGPLGFRLDYGCGESRAASAFRLGLPGGCLVHEDTVGGAPLDRGLRQADATGPAVDPPLSTAPVLDGRPVATTDTLLTREGTRR